MTETVTTTELLDFLAKAHKVSSHVTFKKGNGEYAISIYADWDDNDHFYQQTTHITEKGESNWRSSDYDFFTMNSVLDGLVQKEEEREIKRQKRQELLSRLTDEERELLYLES